MRKSLISISFLVCLFALMPLAAGAGSITLVPTVQAPGSSVTVNGLGFGTSRAVAIAFGAEVASSDSNMSWGGTGSGPYTYSGRASRWPIKPGSFVLTSDASPSGAAVITLPDNGDGTLSSGGTSGTINYATGEWSRRSDIDLMGMTVIYSAVYTRYQYNVTPAAGVSTNASGAFTASITVPAVANGNYNVIVIDSGGNLATATLNVNSVIPEVLPFGAMLLLSSVAVVAGSLRIRKQPRIAHEK